MLVMLIDVLVSSFGRLASDPVLATGGYVKISDNVIFSQVHLAITIHLLYTEKCNYRGK